ncbi:MAG TPA: PIN domain-containing protein [Thermoanaerobaculia bacterium]
MNVYVESNFVLELALLQEEEADCEEILRQCEMEGMRLVIPAYCLMEPYETLIRRKADRRQLKYVLDGQYRQIARTVLYRHQLQDFESATSLLVDTAIEDLARLGRVRSRLLDCAELAPLEDAVLDRAAEQQARHELSAQDAVVFASILVHQERSAEPGCFISRDSDFNDPDIRRELKEHNCKLLIGFGAALQFLRRAV